VQVQYLILQFVLGVILTEAITEILVESVLFERARFYVEAKLPDSLFAILVRCGYCVSVWVGLVVSYALWLAPFDWVSWVQYLQPALMGLVLHRMSNVWHDLIRKLFVWTH